MMKEISEPILKSKACFSVEECLKTAEELGYPLIIRAGYTLGGTGSGIARNKQELIEYSSLGISLSRIKQVLNHLWTIVF